MTLDTDDLINSIMASLGRIEFIKTEDIPGIDLYMDQVTSFIDAHLKNTARNPGDERIMTKTMINNYAKNDLLPPPEKKKYNKEHILLLVFIYYFKNVLTISDIQSLLDPIKEKYYGKDGDMTIAGIYETVAGAGDGQIEKLKEDVLEKYHIAQELFKDEAEGADEEFLRHFSFICLLTFDVYTKKLLIEKMIDGFKKDSPGGTTSGKKPRRSAREARERKNRNK